MPQLPVSVIIPAHNAGRTLAETLDSLLAQTHPQWEAVVVDNASTDDTAAVAAAYAARDPRVRVVAMADKGVSRARNRGLREARSDAILFLDADDWIEPQHMERLTAVLAARPEIDAVHCGWARTCEDGGRREEFGADAEDLYPELARTCVFAIHACIFRRALLARAGGGFDESLHACEDWDLWLRCARAGARFHQVQEVLSIYRTRAGSASMDPLRLVRDGLAVIDRAHAPDPRVPQPVPRYALGLPAARRHAHHLATMQWAAGIAIGSRQDPAPLLELLDFSENLEADPGVLADCLYTSVLVPAGRPPAEWADRYPDLSDAIEALLRQLELRLRRPGLAASTRHHLLHLILGEAARRRPYTLGPVHATAVDIVQPVRDVRVDPSVERVHCEVRVAGEPIGDLELPVFDGIIPAAVMADAIAARYGWIILGRFFAATLYPRLDREREAGGWAVRRRGIVLGRDLPGGSGGPDPEALHAAVGWTVLLQEAWGLPGLAAGQAYHLPPEEQDQLEVDPADVVAGWREVEVSAPLRDLPVKGGAVTVVFTAGGQPIAQKTISPSSGRIPARVLRVAGTIEAGLELCRGCVREALLGRPFDEGGSLRQRLAAAAKRRRDRRGRPVAVAPRVDLGPGALAVLGEMAAQTEGALIVGRHPFASGEATAARRAALPSAVGPEVAELLATTGQPAVYPAGGAPRQIVYAPGCFWRPDAAADPAATVAEVNGGGESYSQEFFENLFNTQPDPWKYTTPYEQTKYAQTLAQLPRRRFDRALELACAEGHFTEQLAPRVGQLVATDVSRTALRRAQERCQAYSNIEYAQLDLVHDPLPGRFDLIVCSEVLYYTGQRAGLRRLAQKLARALQPGGCLVTAHAHVVADEPDQPGFDWDVPFGASTIAKVLGSTPEVKLVRELRTPLYRIQVFQRQGRVRRFLDRRRPRREILSTQPTALHPQVAAHVLWHGGRPLRTEPEPVGVTARLPILMYHRVATDGPAALARYRVAPEQFEQQLAHLRDAGYRSASFEEWQAAVARKQPLPGRRVMLTFDDGYRDFYTEAWPLLRKYGFDATVFLPTGYIGDASRWDQADGEPAPLMTWDEIRRLDQEGVRFGAHTVSHPLLTSLSPTAIARELLRSRTQIQVQLGEPVLCLAYPFGNLDPVVEHLAGASGFLFGVTCEGRPAERSDALLSLPRIEVTGSTALAEFHRLLTGALDTAPVAAPEPAAAVAG